jgi:hypothetical protein
MMPFRQQIHQHSGSYQTIPVLAPQGLLCLKALFQEEDADKPSAATLNTLLAQDFRDVENGNERSKGRSDVVSLIVSRRSRYQKYQTDIGQAWCLINSSKAHTVLFEGIRFIIFRDDTEWIRIPISGRIEVRTISRGGKPSGEIVFRKTTLELTTFWKRRNELSLTSPQLYGDGFQKQHVPLSPLPLVHEMPHNTSPPTPSTESLDTHRLEPDQYIPKPARNSIPMFGRLTETRFWKDGRKAPIHPTSEEDKGVLQPQFFSPNVRGPEYQDHEPLPVGISAEHTPREPEQMRFLSSNH